ncbi:MAG: glycoside hydrolase family 36 protein [Chloroflexota bacterium]
MTRTLPAGSSVTSPVALDIEVRGEAMVLWTMRGGRFEATYPPLAYMPVPRSITPGLPVPPSVGGAHRIEFGSVGGRSSDGDVPLFLLTDLDGTNGLWFAVGHSGRWRGSLTKHAGAPVQRLTLEAPTAPLVAGDAINLPRVVVGAFRGDGWAAIKRFITLQCPRRIQPMVAYNTWFNIEVGIDESSLLAAIGVAADVGIEAVVIDAGWYDEAGADFGGPGLGTWVVDHVRFPRGLEPVAQAAHANGLAIGLWFEPERAHRDSSVARLFPDAFRPVAGTSVGLVDFGSAEVRAWTADTIHRAITSIGLDWLKWDFNVHDAASLWGQDGRAELAHTRGVHAVLDRLLELHPNLVIESCASGGNRIDIEMLARSHVTNLSDEVQSPEIVRRMVGNVCRWLPSQYRWGALGPHGRWAPDGSVSVLGTGAHGYPPAWLASGAVGSMVIHEAITSWGEATKDQVRGQLERVKPLRGYLDMPFRAFLDAGRVPLGGWECWEFADEAPGPALLIAFRQHAPNAEHSVTGARQWTVVAEHDGVAVALDGVPGGADAAAPP